MRAKEKPWLQRERGIHKMIPRESELLRETNRKRHRGMTERHRETDRETDGQIDRWTDRETD